MSSDLGISNFEIERTISSSQNENLINDFIGAFLADKVNRFINFHSMMTEKADAKYPFLISYADTAGTEGTNWWEIHPKTETFLFESFGDSYFTLAFIFNKCSSLKGII